MVFSVRSIHPISLIAFLVFSFFSRSYIFISSFCMFHLRIIKQFFSFYICFVFFHCIQSKLRSNYIILNDIVFCILYLVIIFILVWKWWWIYVVRHPTSSISSAIALLLGTVCCCLCCCCCCCLLWLYKL